MARAGRYHGTSQYRRPGVGIPLARRLVATYDRPSGGSLAVSYNSAVADLYDMSVA